MEKDSFFNKYQRLMEEKENKCLQPYAAFSKNYQSAKEKSAQCLQPYASDVHLILHSNAYARYVDKTQVVYLVHNDHLTYRGLHVQFVSQFARGIAQFLDLNLSLVEAIALGHDVGHPPFGHEGEAYLSKIAVEHGLFPFSHPLQSCRWFTNVEPLNLSLATYDGFLCHDGGISGCVLRPHFGKTWEMHAEEKKKKAETPEVSLVPGTLEGCLVKLCDTLSYLGRDLEDAIKLGIIQREDIPQTILGKTNEEMLNVLATNIIESSDKRDFIAITEDVFDALLQIRRFNFKHIYNHPRLKIESLKIERGYKLLFEWLLSDLEKQREISYMHLHFLSKRSEDYLKNTSMAQSVVDYISGMTDHFFVSTLQKIFIPATIQIG